LKTYLFDFDGTLVDSMPTYISVMLRILEEYDVPYQKDIMKVITPLGYSGTAKYYKKLGVPLSEQEMVEKMHCYALKEYRDHIPAKSHVISALKALKERGAELNVLTASPHEMLDPCLKRLGIWELFTHVWSCEDFAMTKADEAIYLAAAERIGRPVEDILFLDDNYNADRVAAKAGMKVCGVYDDSSAEFADEIRSVSDYYISDFLELLELEW